MACAPCAARRAAASSQKFELTDAQGRKQTFTSEVDAATAKIRRGGTYKKIQ